MKTALKFRINSHPCNEYIIRNYKYQDLWNADSVTSGTFRVDIRWTGDKKQLNPDYYQLNDSLTFL